MKNKYYLLVRNKIDGTMELVATFKSPGDAGRCCKLFNNDLQLTGNTSVEYGVSNNPMIWSYYA